jgi:hypothetical protein
VRSFYFIQSVYTIYLCMGMVIYLFYLLLEAVMLIRITILNRFNLIEVFNHLRRDRKLVGSKRVERTVTGFESDDERWVYRLTSLYSNVIWNNVRMIRMRTK